MRHIFILNCMSLYLIVFSHYSPCAATPRPSQRGPRRTSGLVAAAVAAAEPPWSTSGHRQEAEGGCKGRRKLIVLHQEGADECSQGGGESWRWRPHPHGPMCLLLRVVPAAAVLREVPNTLLQPQVAGWGGGRSHGALGQPRAPPSEGGWAKQQRERTAPLWIHRCLRLRHP